jgi:hypothetical protein
VLLRGRKVDNMLWVSLGIIVVFGGATLILKDPTFIKWKPTVLYWLFAAVLLISDFGFRKNLIKIDDGKQITLPEPVWRRLSLNFGRIFFRDGRAESLRRLQLFRKRLGEFQAVRRHGPDVRVHPFAGPDARKICRRRGNQMMPAAVTDNSSGCPPGSGGNILRP